MAAKELVDDMKLMAEIHPEGTYHPTFEPEYIGGIWSQKREFWKKEKALGQGAYGKVWLEQCTLGEGHSKLRAVKRIRKPKNPSHMIYCEQELEAFAKFSQQKVRKTQHWIKHSELTSSSTQGFLSNRLAGSRMKAQFSLLWNT